eukprot:TRINITY_DN44_c0_g1_i1.p1 TRINITY_DN44_c0_g1~~TRINITY_DN44_c0_g1_i1.p1  ORF type:complete len:400 (+),score=140.27 TRINITY_DN44_c0_g1_i1:66-1265(+)
MCIRDRYMGRASSTALSIIGLAVLAVAVSGASIRRVYPRNALVALHTQEEMHAQLKAQIKARPSFTEFVAIVQNLLQTNAPIDKVYTLFDELINEVNQEQFRHDEMAYEQRAQCDEELTYRKNEVNEATIALGKATEDKDICEGELSKAQAAYAINVLVQKTKERELKTLDEIRKAENDLFLERQKEHKEALRVIDNALPLVKALLGESPKTSFIQVMKGQSSVGASSMAILVGLFATHKSVSYGRVAQILAQMTESPEIKREDVLRLIQMINNLRQNIENSLNEITRVENEAVEGYTRTTGDIQALLDTLKTQEKELTEIIDDSNSCIADADATIAVESTRKRESQSILEQSEVMCTTSEQQYQAASKSRQEAIQLYRQILEWLKDYFKKNSIIEGNQ